MKVKSKIKITVKNRYIVNISGEIIPFSNLLHFACLYPIDLVLSQFLEYLSQLAQHLNSQLFPSLFCLKMQMQGISLVIPFFPKMII